MENYYRVATVSDNDIDSYLEKGWKIIDTTKYSYDRNENMSNLIYHIGYPLDKQNADLLSIVHLYEEHGFKEKLFEKMANDKGIDLSNYSTSGGVLTGEKNDVINIIKKYENVVNKKEITFYKKISSTDELDYNEIL